MSFSVQQHQNHNVFFNNDECNYHFSINFDDTIYNQPLMIHIVHSNVFYAIS